MTKKVKAKTDNSGWTDPAKKKKPRKKRKPMTPEQREAAVERLKKAREVRAKNNPNYGMSSLHHSLRDLDEDYELHPDKVKVWIAYQKELLSLAKKDEKNKEKGSTARVSAHESYIKNMNNYLKDGVWNDLFYGEERDLRVPYVCTAMAYHHDGPYKGMAKRTVGVWYPDIRRVYTKKMFEEDRIL